MPNSGHFPGRCYSLALSKSAICLAWSSVLSAGAAGPLLRMYQLLLLKNIQLAVLGVPIGGITVTRNILDAGGPEAVKGVLVAGYPG
jgi:hypothetical protein